jgi:hypothetical protein
MVELYGLRTDYSVLRLYTGYEICSPETVSVPHNPRLL